ncbi:Hypothetical Protein FCC1311_010462 [Hondaea fermentalgiana]|uniref:Uncharacterized protein n=1 Tax=Hondaea fermentalgiana TaxID=2315210 RepID=A0A2R5G4W2_9STRA|nr:Hypothetical Protein FCC1311_010462 [Hondaea fermentalgiana]|eukprot:GBG24828.1 Hypothetical Protein FCC1311_010462 [Hondaea fermentalgiana]
MALAWDEDYEGLGLEEQKNLAHGYRRDLDLDEVDQHLLVSDGVGIFRAGDDLDEEFISCEESGSESEDDEEEEEKDQDPLLAALKSKLKNRFAKDNKRARPKNRRSSPAQTFYDLERKNSKVKVASIESPQDAAQELLRIMSSSSLLKDSQPLKDLAKDPNCLCCTIL